MGTIARAAQTRRLVRYVIALAGTGAAFAVWLLLHSGPAAAITPGTGTGCTRYWMGWVSTDWHNIDNWSSIDGGFGGVPLPGPSDVACMGTAPITSSVILSGAAVTVGGIQFGATGSVSPTLTISSATLTVNGSGGTINSLTLNASTLNGSGGVSLTGASQTTGLNSYIYGSGQKSVNSGASVTVNSGLIVGSSACTDPAALSVSGSIVLNAGLYLCTADTASSATGLSLSGSMQIAPNMAVAVGGYGTKVVRPVFVNTGQVQARDAGQSSFIVNLLFANLGTVDGNGGSFDLTNSASPPGLPDTGTYTIGFGTLVVNAGSREFDNGSTTGELAEFNGANVAFDGDYTLSSLDLSSSTATCASALYVSSLQTSRYPSTAPTSQIGCAVLVQSQAVFHGLELLPTASLTLNGTTAIEADGGDITLDSNAVILEDGTLFAEGTGPVALRSAAPLSTTVIIDTDATLEVDTTFTLASDYFYMQGSVRVGDSGDFIVGGGLPVQDQFDSEGNWQVDPGSRLEFRTPTVFHGYVLGGGGVITQARNAAFTFTRPTTFTSLVSAGVLAGPVTVGNFTSHNARVTDVTGYDPAPTPVLTLSGTSSVTGLTVQNGASVVNAGRLTIHRSRAVQLLTGGNLVDNGVVSISGAGTAGISGDGSTGSGLTFNSGSTTTATLSTAGASLTVSAPLTNNGTLRVRKGTVALTGAVSNLAGGTLNGGTWEADGGTLALPTALTTNNATIIVTATATSAITVAGTTTPALASLAGNSGALTLAQPLTLSNSLTTKGTLTISAALHVSGFTQTGGAVTLTGDLFSASPVSVTDGTFSGTGKIDGNLVNSGGILAPGSNGVGTLSINGSFSQSAGSVQVTLTKSELDVSGTVTLGGNLALRTPTPHPALGTTAAAVAAVGTVSGHFARVTGRAVNGTGTWVVTYPASEVLCTLAA